LEKGWRTVLRESAVVLAPMSDGGEGTVDAVLASKGGQHVHVTASDPLLRPVEAGYGTIENGSTAVLEMAAASGLQLVAPAERDPRAASTRGTGELMVHALDHGASRIVLGIGGSATNDGGAGMAQALGFRLLDAESRELPPGGAALLQLNRIDGSKRHAGLDRCRIDVACDVDNPLCGPRGASRVYGPQKGAALAVAEELDAALDHFAAVVERDLGIEVRDTPGAGAAGGLGAGLMAFAGARLQPGVPLIAELVGLDGKLAEADLVLTGEGRVDEQTVYGKVPAGVAKLAKRYGLPVVTVAGALGNGYESVYDHGIDAVYAIAPPGTPQEESMASAAVYLEATGERIARDWQAAAIQPLSGG